MSLDGHWIFRRPDFLLFSFVFLPPLKLIFTFLVKQLLQGQEGHRLVYILFPHHVFINRESCATVNFSFSALLVSRYKVTNKSTWINCKSRCTALYTPSCDENST